MPERIKEILQKVLDWWNKFTSRQKTIIVGLAATVIFAFAIVIYVSTQPKYVDLTTAENAARAAEVEELLTSAGIQHKASPDGLRFSVEQSQYQTAVWTLGANGYGADEYTIQQALSGSISTTASDKEKLTVAAYQSKLEKLLTGYANIKKATVILNIPADTGTLVRERQEASAFITLELDGTFTSANAANVARGVSTWLGNKTTSNITILDSESNLLFAGGDDYSTTGTASSIQDLQSQWQAMINHQVKTVLLGSKQFDNAEVACILDLDMSSREGADHTYTAPDGHEQGYYLHTQDYSSIGENSGSYVPGTDSNDETVYVSPDSNNSSSEQTETLRDYILNEHMENYSTPAGSVRYNTSHMSVSLIRYHEYHEEDVRRQGLLDGSSWEEFQDQHKENIKLEVDPDYYSMVQNSSKIPMENIMITAYELPVFVDKEGLSSSDYTNIVSLILLVVILGLLAFVILRSMGSRAKVATEEEELSVESLLQSTPEAELEDIDVEGKSETRKMIEKFVDENPEAAAALLRNWLSEDW
ncbi:MAG: flagellar M-ring protein FliF [Lachnospiraceae bacterium]|nr:flagellar M-ring protein FliF [Lachnospiraceae bacterium]